MKADVNRPASTDTKPMALSGHRCIELFKRCNTIAPQDRQKAIYQLGTYMDTEAHHDRASTHKNV
jgi:hypothetical protein